MRPHHTEKTHDCRHLSCQGPGTLSSIAQLTSNDSASAKGCHLAPLEKPTDPLRKLLPHSEDNTPKIFPFLLLGCYMSTQLYC